MTKLQPIETEEVNDDPRYIRPVDAKNKLCYRANNNYYCCCADLCMAWRWKVNIKNVPNEKGEYLWPPQTEYSTTHGYCGMVKS